MFAQALRKWSSLLMYLYQFYLILLFSSWWNGAFAMHLAPSSFNTYRSATNPPLLSPDAALALARSSHSSPISSSNATSIQRTDVVFRDQRQREEQALARWQQRMFEKRLRIREHRRQILELRRSRRESGRRFRGPPTRARPSERKRFCSARDPATLAFEAPTVFVGKVKSMSSDRRSNFSVTFEVVNKTKHPNGWELPRNVRLQFAYRNNTVCDIYREDFRERGYLKKPLELGKLYFLFVKQIDLGNFTILGTPLRKNNHTLRAVLKGVSDNYGRRASIVLLKDNVTVQEGKKLRLVCKVDGQPPPKVTWFKDRRSINKSRDKYNFVHTKKKSELTVNVTKLEDAGSYECRVKNKIDKQTVSKFSIVTVQPLHVTEPPPRSSVTFEGFPCNSTVATFCLKGTCRDMPLTGLYCACETGYTGQRCDEKLPDKAQKKTRHSYPMSSQEWEWGSYDYEEWPRK